MVDDNVVQDFVNAIKTETDKKNRTYSAVVSRIDNEGVVWVYLAGSHKDTPAANTSAEVEVGDSVNVEWRNNKLYIVGNYSNPSAGAIRVDAVEIAAQVANTAAQNAVADAGVARDAAESAQATAEAVEGIANDAQTSADEAKISADNAEAYANTAFSHMSIVEDIVGVLDLIAKDGEYVPTTDMVVAEGKWYFTRSGTEPNYEYALVQSPQSIEYALTSDVDIVQGKTYYTRTGTGTEEDPYIYSVVEDPVVADIGTYYECLFYELAGIKESIQNYVSSHLVLLNDGLHLRTSGTNAEIWISDNGVVIKDANGSPIGQYGGNAVIGNPDGFHIEIDADELAFYHGARDEEKTNRVAYVSGQELYITKSVVLQQMDLGTPKDIGGGGQWSWKIHKNADGDNNLHLKWIG